ncbi:hypothetical protein SAMN05428983_0848 [Agrobacterium fabrum]|uniref:Uncharacterized protein n=1 Tax=Agrobacterium fabrum TaxID=1176649 RepID=A0A7Z7BHW9_9HYPH|nr:hypothetical protein SAMN05428983_0848 [Agrobacterium fabrum]
MRTVLILSVLGLAAWFLLLSTLRILLLIGML